MTAREVPRRTALLIVGVGAVVLLAAIVLLWSRGESGSTSAFCSSLHAGENPLDVFDRYDPTNVASARADLQRGLDRLRQLERAAPSQINDDMKVLVDVAQQLVKALDPGATSTTIPDFTSQFDRVSSASANVTRFASEACAVTLDSGVSGISSAQPPGSSSSSS